MRKIGCVRILVLILCLGLTGMLIYLRPATQVPNRKIALEQTLLQIKNWEKVSASPLDPIVAKELKLDDYVFNSYSQGGGNIDLYVGYYYSSSKVGAAHDPLVCFPGQGWQVSHNQKGSFQFTDNVVYKINYSMLQAEKDSEKELVYYWYQAGYQATSGPLAQKIMLLSSKFLHRSENNAFIRISTPVNGNSFKDEQKRILSFIKDFYPIFLEYIK